MGPGMTVPVGEGWGVYTVVVLGLFARVNNVSGSESMRLFLQQGLLVQSFGGARAQIRVTKSTG